MPKSGRFAFFPHPGAPPLYFLKGHTLFYNGERGGVTKPPPSKDQEKFWAPLLEQE